MGEIVKPVVSLKYFKPSHAVIIVWSLNPLEEGRVARPAVRYADVVHRVPGVEFIGRDDHPPIRVGGKVEVQA